MGDKSPRKKEIKKKKKVVDTKPAATLQSIVKEKNPE